MLVCMSVPTYGMTMVQYLCYLHARLPLCTIGTISRTCSWAFRHSFTNSSDVSSDVLTYPNWGLLCSNSLIELMDVLPVSGRWCVGAWSWQGVSWCQRDVATRYIFYLFLQYIYKLFGHFSKPNFVRDVTNLLLIYQILGTGALVR